MAEASPELAGEHRHRALAAGAGDGHHGPGLAAEEPGCDVGQGGARLLGHQGRQVGGGDGPRVAQHGHRACGPRVGQEPAAVGARARHGREQIAGADRARVEG